MPYTASVVTSPDSQALPFVDDVFDLVSSRHPDVRSLEVAASQAESAGLRVVDLRQETYDIGAVTYFLRKVVWTVPGFTV